MSVNIKEIFFEHLFIFCEGNSLKKVLKLDPLTLEVSTIKLFADVITAVQSFIIQDSSVGWSNFLQHFWRILKCKFLASSLLGSDFKKTAYS